MHLRETAKTFVYKKNRPFQKTKPCLIEKYIIVLDKMYRCFILRCLNIAFRKEKENKERNKIPADKAATIQFHRLRHDRLRYRRVSNELLLMF
jgi:hypothetical protein